VAEVSLLALGLLTATAGLAQMGHGESHTSKPFNGAKANKGTVTHTNQDGNSVLTLSNDFVVPDTPDPHWMVVDSEGTTYLLAKLKLKNDGYNRSITLPVYVKDVSKVIIWCAWAETNLGEASFDAPVK
jgi:hypothetical protein